MVNNKLTLKEYFLAPIDKKISVERKIIKLAKKFQEDGDSISVVIRKTYVCSDCTLTTVNHIIRAAPEIIKKAMLNPKINRKIKTTDLAL